MESGVLRQITLTLIVSTMALSSGMSTGWLTPMTPKLRRFDSPVGRMTKQDISHLAAVPLYVGFFVAFAYGFIAKKFGRKDALICVGIPSIVSGLILTFTKSKVALFVGRSFGGCTMIGGVMASFMYVSETVNDSIRGTLMTILAFQINVGILLSNVLGDTLSYETFNFIGIAIPVVSSILILWLPESPHFLVDNDRIKDAMRSLLWLKEGDHIAAKSELESIKPDRTAERHISILQVLKFRGSRTALVVSLLACILQCLSGIHATLYYADILSKSSISLMSPAISTNVISLLTLTSTLVCAF
uniref:Facilitated trehalose transporter Tret1 n=1 Tax=Lygus hesperus TaxID=30085 RepID=A0A0A9YQ42_LYGHE